MTSILSGSDLYYQRQVNLGEGSTSELLDVAYLPCSRWKTNAFANATTQVTLANIIFLSNQPTVFLNIFE
jgi:hypothetical protein